MLLSASVATLALISQQWTDTRGSDAVPDEGYYWAVAQYQIAHLRLKQELRVIAAGEPANVDVLAQRTAVLASKASILSEPSELGSHLQGVPGFVDSANRIAALQRQIAPILDKKAPFAPADAAAVLSAFRAMGDEELLGRLANDVRLAEVTAKQTMMQDLGQRIQWVWIGLGLCWTALALWMLHTVRARQRLAVAADERQHAVDAMERAIATKRRFMSMVSHEVRSPLQSIVTSAESLSLRDSRPESVAAIRRIRHAVSALQGQLRDLLTLARSDLGQPSLQVETFEFGALVRDVCADFQDLALAKGLAFEVEMPNAPITVTADPVRIAQVLRNLVENAVRNTETGRVEVDVRPADNTAGIITGSGRVVFTVQDTGPGLPAQALQRLQCATVPFELGSDGSRMGLFVIREVLQQLGGGIVVHANPGQGTTFTVDIPVALAEDASGPASTTETLRLLIVDDREDVLTALVDLTHRLGHSCDAVLGAAAAQALLAHTPYDAVLIDLEMPGKDGLTLANEIRQNDGPNRTSMLILISAAENRVIGLAAPFDGFLQKPIDQQALRRLIGSQNSR